ncbi:MAG TPA: head-tail adaptor protein [Thermoguttaceae bacterium]|nr:head-tail adaptor protein [Thermoguttaceae bacterium]
MRRTRKRFPRAGHRDTRIIVYKQDQSQTANDDGEFPEDAKELCRRWAEIIPLRGNLVDLQSSQEANVSHVLRVAHDDVTATIDDHNWIMVAGTTRRFNISAAIDLDNLHRVIELECTERL